MSFSFKAWAYHSTEDESHLLVCSKYGLIAHATNNNLSIYFEEYGHSTPLIMWCPFEQNITALGWYNASMTIYNTVPVLIFSSSSGILEVFDCRSRKSILIGRINILTQPINDSIHTFQFPTPITIPINIANSKRENDYITSIKWYQFSPSCFFVGTKNGRLILFKILIGHIVKCQIILELFFDFEIDYISIEPQFGEMCVIASKSGSIATINNIDKYEKGKLPKTSPHIIKLANQTDSIKEVKFYPTSTEFLILVTTSNSLLYSISGKCTAPLLMLPGIMKLYSIHSTKNVSLIVRDNSVELWTFLPNESQRIAEAKLSSVSKIAAQKEIIASDMMGEQLILITAQMWLTTIEVRNSTKLFVTRRVKLLDAKPTAFSYLNESIAIATSAGNILITETLNPIFVTKMSFKSQSSTKLIESQNQSSLNNEQNIHHQQDQNNIQNQDNLNNRVRKSIINSCPSNSSLFIESFNIDINQNEEMLEKSIVISNDTNDTNNKVPPLFANVPCPILKQNTKPRRRVSAVTVDTLKNNTVLSCVMNEGIKNTPKQPIANTRPRLPRPSVASIIPRTERELSLPQDPRPSLEATKKISESVPKFDEYGSFDSTCIDSQKNVINHEVTNLVSKYKFGNNCTLMWNYQIANNLKIDHIEWIASTRAIAYTLSKKVVCKDHTDKTGKEESDHGNNFENAGFSGSSFIYIIDFKYHRITRFFDKPGINISDITFSANKQYFFITVNGLIVDLFQNKQKPKKIHSFTFTTNVYVAFIAYYLVFVDANGNIYRNRFELGHDFELKLMKAQIKMKKEYGHVTCIIGQKNGVLMGTSTGYVLNVDFTNFNVSEIIVMKASVLFMQAGLLESILVKDAKDNTTIITSDCEKAMLPTGIKTFAFASSNILLIRKKNRPFIEIYQTTGQFVPSIPKVALRCPMMMPTNRWMRSLLKEDPLDQNVLFNYGLSYIANLVDAKRSPNFTYNHILHLRNLIIDTPQLWKTAYKLSILLRDFKTARNVISTSSILIENKQEWAMNMAKCATFIRDDKSKDQSRIDDASFAGINLIKNEFVDDGVDILISAGLWTDAVKALLEIGMIKEAAQITKIYGDQNNLDVLNDVTKKLFKFPNFIFYALSMLCEKGLEKQAIRKLELLRQFDSAKVLAKVLSNID